MTMTADALIAALPRTTSLTYIAYDDSLSDERVQQALTDYNGLANDLDDLAMDDRWRAEQEYVEAAVAEVDPDADADDLDDEVRDQVVDAIRDRDDSNPVKDLLRNTSDVLLRYRIGQDDADGDLCPWATGGRIPEDEHEANAMRLCAMTGLDYQANADAFRQLVIEQDYYGGILWVIWSGSVTAFVEATDADLRLDEDDPKPARTITWTDPYVVLLDGWNGSGHDARMTGTITLPYDADLLRLDSQGPGYGWDSICGLVRGAYACDADLTVTPAAVTG